jgi:hypothetical protein
VELRRTDRLFLTWISVLIIAFTALVLAPVWKRHGAGNSLARLLPVVVQPAQVNPWTTAAEKVKEDRGEPVGKQAGIETPAQLQHYSDSRRFLATQVAEVVEHKVSTPADFVDLAAMINRNELVQVQPVTENYILFGVGGSADRQPFTRYDKGKSVNLYNEAGLQQEYARLAESQVRSANEIAGLKLDIRNLKRRDRSQRVQRAKLQAQITTAEKALKLDRENKELLDRFYGTGAARQQLFADYESLAQLGRKLDGNAFDIADADARRQLKVRMLSSLRPEALSVLEEIAASYHEKFNRPLPITSLVRPDEYQLELSKTNANATRIETPPHATGLAFDILYRYMTAAEQLHVMSELARLKDAGRIEVLRENRDHYHLFAFVDGARPREEFIAAALGGVRSGKAAAAQTIDARAMKVAKGRTAKQRSEAHHAMKKVESAKRKVQTAKSARRPGGQKRKHR